MVDMRTESPGTDVVPVKVGRDSRYSDMEVYERSVPVRESADDDEIDLRVLWNVLRRHKWAVLAILSMCLILGFVDSIIQRPVYRAQTLLEIKPHGNTKVSFQNLEESDVPAWTILGTQENILLSESIARGVLTGLELHDDPELNGEIQQRGLMRGIKHLLWKARSVVSSYSRDSDYAASAPSAVDPPTDLSSTETSSVAIGQAPEVDLPQIKNLVSRLRVEAVEDSMLLRVFYDSFDKVMAAKIVNAVAQEYVRQNEERRFSATSGAKRHLEVEIEQVRARLEHSESALTAFARDREIIDVEDGDNIVVDRLAELSRNFTQTQSLRLSAQAEYEKAKDGDVAYLPAVRDLEIVQNLKKNREELQSEYGKLSEIYKKEYPTLVQLRSQIAEVDAAISREADKVVKTLKSRYEQLLEEEQLIESALASQRVVLLDQKDRSVKYNTLKREWETNKQLYSGLLERMKELGIAAGLELDNVSIIDKASVPLGAFHPNLTRNLGIAMIIGLLLGIAVALVLAYLDNSIDTVEKLESVTKVASLGIVPKIALEQLSDSESIELIAFQDRSNEVSEAFRSVRTGLMFSSPYGAPRTLAVTSSIPAEGKSVTSANLALVMAQSEYRVLLVDADLRNSRVHSIFSIPCSPGLSEVLANNVDPIPIRKTEIPTLDILPAGTKPENPVELLGSSRMDDFLATVSEHYDMVVLDVPPALGLADAVVLGTKVDGILLVVSAQQVSQEAVRETAKRFRLVRAPLIGAILNQVTSDSVAYDYPGKHYYQYGNDGVA